MSAWNHESADLFRASRTAMSPTSADKERVRARLAARLGASAVGAAAVVAASTTAAAGATTKYSSAASAVFKLLATAAVGGSVTIAVTHLVGRTASTPPAPITSAAVTPDVAAPEPLPTPAPSATEAAPPAPRLAATEELPAARRARPERATGAPHVSAQAAPDAHTPADPLEEARLVRALDGALRAGDGTRALALADEHARRFPRGTLVHEREGGRVLARCLTGARASSGADGFLAAHPRSPMRTRILAACGTGKDGER